jgi:hypothetical protein
MERRRQGALCSRRGRVGRRTWRDGLRGCLAGGQGRGQEGGQKGAWSSRGKGRKGPGVLPLRRPSAGCCAARSPFDQRRTDEADPDRHGNDRESTCRGRLEHACLSPNISHVQAASFQRRSSALMICSIGVRPLGQRHALEIALTGAGRDRTCAAQRLVRPSLLLDQHPALVLAVAGWRFALGPDCDSLGGDERAAGCFVCINRSRTRRCEAKSYGRPSALPTPSLDEGDEGRLTNFVAGTLESGCVMRNG